MQSAKSLPTVPGKSGGATTGNGGGGACTGNGGGGACATLGSGGGAFSDLAVGICPADARRTLATTAKFVKALRLSVDFKRAGFIKYPFHSCEAPLQSGKSRY